MRDQKKQGKDITRGSLVESFDQRGITHIVVEAPSVKDYLSEGSKGRGRLDAAQIILVDESMTFNKYSDQESLRTLLAYAKESGKKIVLVGGGPLDASQQNNILNELLTDVDESTDESQFVEVSPSLLTESQAKDFLIVKGFTQDWATHILAQLDTFHVPLIMRVLLQIIPPNPGQDMTWEEYSTIALTKESFQNLTNHLELQSDLGDIHTDGPESTLYK